jgi:hypothetical protein
MLLVLAVLNSGWKANGGVAQVTGSVFWKPLAMLAQPHSNLDWHEDPRPITIGD